jgi:hypothetical protein
MFPKRFNIMSSSLHVGRPGWAPKVAFYDTAPDRSEEVMRDTKAKAVGPDLMHTQRLITSKSNNFNKRYHYVTDCVAKAFMFNNVYDMAAIDNALMTGTWVGNIGRAVHVDSIKTRVESAYGSSA